MACLALVGCNSNPIHARQPFFPGSELTSWSACGEKFSGASGDIAICASVYPASAGAIPTYNILFSLPNDARVLIAVFDGTADLVKVLLDQDELASPPGFFRQPPVAWDFKDANGHGVPAGSYRVYFKSGDFQSTSDLVVE